jgi:hypothetical protein
MKLSRLVSSFGGVLLAAVSAGAQAQPGNIAALEFQTPKNGMVKQYEDGRKQKADWHKQQKDPQALLVWQILSGDHTGTYVVGRVGQHWADMDKPAVSDKDDLEEYQKVVAPFVQSMVARYYSLMPKVSNPPAGMTGPSKYSEVLNYSVRIGSDADFRSAVTRIDEAIKKTKWPVNYEWYELVNGGRDGSYVLVIPHANWADFADKPDMKPFRDMLKEAFGQSEADSILKRLDSSLEKVWSEAIEFRADLSYLPAK